MGDQVINIRGEGIVVVTGPGLIGATKTTTVKRNNPIAVIGQEFHLAVPHIGIQRPAVAEQHRFTGAPVLEVDLCAVGRFKGAHGIALCMT